MYVAVLVNEPGMVPKRPCQVFRCKKRALHMPLHDGHISLTLKKL